MYLRPASLAAFKAAASFASPAEAAAHPGEELLLVLSGTIEMRFADRGFVLETGDCVQFPGHLSHRLRQVGTEASSALVAVARVPQRRGVRSDGGA